MKTPALAAARDLSPLIASLRENTEASRNLAGPIVDRLRDARLCRLAVAEELGGLETPIDAALDVYETLAYADASVGWIAWNNSLPCFLGGSSPPPRAPKSSRTRSGYTRARRARRAARRWQPTVIA